MKILLQKMPKDSVSASIALYITDEDQLRLGCFHHGTPTISELIKNKALEEWTEDVLIQEYKHLLTDEKFNEMDSLPF